MSTNASHPDKSSVLNELEFTDRTRKRAQWEAFAFKIPSENQIRVINESYGHEADEHVYTVTVEYRADGTIVPLYCDCAANMHYDGDCKHMVACAIRPVVLGAAVAYADRDRAADSDEDTLAVLADGGAVVEPERGEHECVANEKWCPGIPQSAESPAEVTTDELPCWDCWCWWSETHSE